MSNSDKKGEPDAKDLLDEVLRRLACARNDEEAWTLLYTRMWPWVLTNVHRHLRGLHVELAEDVGQEVFIKLLRSCDFKELAQPDRFRSYLWTVCRNASNDYRAQMLKVKRRMDIAAEISGLKESQKHREGPDQTAQFAELIARILGRLDSEDRELLHLLMGGHSRIEIAATMRITPNNATVRIYRMRKRLQLFLSKEPGPTKTEHRRVPDSLATRLDVGRLVSRFIRNPNG
jgi:RNA polymerase sigma factor (sigma-70 family)